MKRLICFLLLSVAAIAQSPVIYSGSNLTIPSQVFIPFGGGGNASSQEGLVALPAPIAGTVNNLFVQVNPAPLPGNALVVVLRDNSTSQVLTCSIFGPSSSCSDSIDSFTVSPGDKLDWQLSPGGVIGISSINIGALFTPAPSAPINGLVFLCQASTPIASKVIGPCIIPSPPPGKQWRKMFEFTYVSAYGAPGDTVGDQYNGDVGNNYRFECNTMAAGGTTFAAGANTAVSTNVLKLAPADSNLNRNITNIINSSPDKAERTVEAISLTGTNSAGTQAAFDLCNGAWVSSVGTQITSITQVTFNGNMGANSGFVVFGVAW